MIHYTLIRETRLFWEATCNLLRLKELTLSRSREIKAEYNILTLFGALEKSRKKKNGKCEKGFKGEIRGGGKHTRDIQICLKAKEENLKSDMLLLISFFPQKLFPKLQRQKPGTIFFFMKLSNENKQSNLFQFPVLEKVLCVWMM